MDTQYRDKKILLNIEKLKHYGAKTVTEQSELFENISTIKDASDNFHTNFFLSFDKLTSWIIKKRVLICSDSSTILVIYVREEYAQIYFWSNDLNGLELLLMHVVNHIDMTFLVDMVYKDVEWLNDKIFFILDKCGFSKHMTLERMSKVNMPDDVGEIKGIEFAEKEDAQEIQDILFQNFDIYGMQIPDIEEIEQASINHDIIISREGTTIAALFWTEHIGQTSHFRYWIARPECRATGLYGYYVYMQTLNREARARRIILWVLDNNKEVIDSHKLQGFSFDGLKDDIFLRKIDV